MNNYESLKHTKWECKYHIVFIPKYRKKALYGQLRKELGAVLRELASQRESKVEEGHLMLDHVHRDYIKHQEKEDQRLDQLEMFK